MDTPFNVGSAIGMSLVPALLAAAALHWRVGRMAPRPHGDRITTGIICTITSAIVVFVISKAMFSPDAAEDATRVDQPLMVLSGVVGFLVGRALLGKPSQPGDADK